MNTSSEGINSRIVIKSSASRSETRSLSGDLDNFILALRWPPSVCDDQQYKNMFTNIKPTHTHTHTQTPVSVKVFKTLCFSQFSIIIYFECYFCYNQNACRMFLINNHTFINDQIIESATESFFFIYHCIF